MVRCKMGHEQLFGQWLKKQRRESGLYISTLSILTRTSPRTIFAIEDGRQEAPSDFRRDVIGILKGWISFAAAFSRYANDAEHEEERRD